MAVKRSFSVKNSKQCNCLKCGAQILPENLKDNSVYICAKCGQKMTVDRYENRAVLTVIERQDLRRRIPPEIINAAPHQEGEILKLLQENEVLKNQLHIANNKIAELKQKARDWQQAADGLAHMIEEIKTEEMKQTTQIKMCIEKRKEKDEKKDRFGSENPKRQSRTQLK